MTAMQIFLDIAIPVFVAFFSFLGALYLFEKKKTDDGEQGSVNHGRDLVTLDMDLQAQEKLLKKEIASMKALLATELKGIKALKKELAYDQKLYETGKKVWNYFMEIAKTEARDTEHMDTWPVPDIAAFQLIFKDSDPEYCERFGNLVIQFQNKHREREILTSSHSYSLDGLKQDKVETIRKELNEIASKISSMVHKKIEIKP